MRELTDSGVEWVGVIPTTWSMRQAGQLADQTKTPNEGLWETNLLSLSYGKVKRKDINTTEGLLPASFETYNIVQEGDIVLRFTDLQNDQKSLRVGRAVEKGIITSAYVTIRPFERIDSRYLYYALHSYDLRKGFYGMGAGVRQGLKWQEAKYIQIPWPNMVERARIADYLDDKCAEIDRAVEAAEGSIEEYKAYKESIVSHAVTKGLEKHAEMKDSGVEWLGNVPKSWKILPSKQVFFESKEKRHSTDERLTPSQNYGVVSQLEYMRMTGSKIVLADKGLDDWKHVEPNDFIISLRSFQGGLEMSRVIGCVTWHYIVTRARKPICFDYFRFAFKSTRYIDALRSTCQYLRDGQDLRFSNFIQVPLPIPPIEEQRRIADYLDERCAQIDRAIAAKRAIIADLKAYKQSLIYEVVTGKREV